VLQEMTFTCILTSTGILAINDTTCQADVTTLLNSLGHDNLHKKNL